MSSTLFVEYFDTDTSSYTHRLKVPLKSSGTFRVNDANLLEADHSDGTTRFVPLLSVKQYYEQPAGYHVHHWDLDSKPVDEITEESCQCGARRQIISANEKEGTTTTIPIVEPVQPDGEDPEHREPVEETSAGSKDNATQAPFVKVLVDELLRRAKQAGFEVAVDLETASAEEKAGFLLEVLVEADIVPRKP